MVYKTLVNGFNEGLKKSYKIIFKMIYNVEGLVFTIWPLGFMVLGL